jgi:hypothetical protein
MGITIAFWSAYNFYNAGDEVLYDVNGFTYKALTSSYNQAPPSFPLVWLQIGGGANVESIASGAGISVNSTQPKYPIVSTNLSSADGRLQISNPSGTQVLLTNNSPASVAPGTAISVAGVPLTGLTINNTGLNGIVPGLGISVSGGSTATIANSGVVDIQAGSGIQISTPAPGTRQITEVVQNNTNTKNYASFTFNGNCPPGITSLCTIPMAGFSPADNVYFVSFRVFGSVNFQPNPGQQVFFRIYITDSPTGAFDPTHNSPCSWDSAVSGGTFGTFDTGGTLSQNFFLSPPANLYLVLAQTTSGTYNSMNATINVAVSSAFSGAYLPT